MATTYRLTVPLRDPADTPLQGVTVEVLPMPYNYSDDGAIVTGITKVTDATGSVDFNLLPSAPDSIYLLRISKPDDKYLTEPIYFKMPAKNTDIDNILNEKRTIQMANEASPSEPALVTTTIPLPTIQVIRVPDIDLDGATTGDGWGAWTDVYSSDNGTSGNVYDQILGELSFDPQWIGGPNANGQIEIKVDHLDAQMQLVISVLPYLNLHIPVVSGTPEAQSIAIAGAAILKTGEHLVVRARARRQNARAGTVKIIGAQSSLERIRETEVSISHLLSSTTSAPPSIVTDTSLHGVGSSSNPLAVANPFTAAYERKLDGIEPGATADQTSAEIISLIESATGMGRLSATYLRDLPAGATPTALGGLTDVSIPAVPGDGTVLTYVAGSRDYQLRALPSANLVALAEGFNQLTGADRILRTSLRGETTVLGGTTLPPISGVPAFAVRALQATNQDVTTLHIAGAQYEVPTTNRNELDLTLVNGNFRVPDSVDGGTGSASNNYRDFVGFVSTGSTIVTVAVYWPIVNASYQSNPPLHLFISTPATGIGATQFNLNSASDRYVTIKGLQYTQYNVSSSAFASGLRGISGEQNWEFHTNNAATGDLNILPPTHLTSGTWHQVGIVIHDATLTGDGAQTQLSVANPFTPADKTKLTGIEAGAEVNVKSDWLASSGKQEILNKPTIPAAVGDLTDVTSATPAKGEALVYDGTGYVNTRVDNPLYVDLDMSINNISASSGDHLLIRYTWTELQLATIEFAVGFQLAYKIVVTTDEPFLSLKLRKTGATGAFIGSASLSGRVNSQQTATATGIDPAMLEPSLDIYLNRSTGTTATISNVKIFLLLYK